MTHDHDWDRHLQVLRTAGFQAEHISTGGGCYGLSITLPSGGDLLLTDGAGTLEPMTDYPIYMDGRPLRWSVGAYTPDGKWAGSIGESDTPNVEAPPEALRDWLTPYLLTFGWTPPSDVREYFALHVDSAQVYPWRETVEQARADFDTWAQSVPAEVEQWDGGDAWPVMILIARFRSDAIPAFEV